jgi:hypothetical protein
MSHEVFQACLKRWVVGGRVEVGDASLFPRCVSRDLVRKAVGKQAIKTNLPVSLSIII